MFELTLEQNIAQKYSMKKMNIFFFPLPGIDLEYLSIQVERVIQEVFKKRSLKFVDLYKLALKSFVKMTSEYKKSI